MTRCPECAEEIHLNIHPAMTSAEFLQHREDVMAQHCADYPNEHPFLTEWLVNQLLADIR